MSDKKTKKDLNASNLLSIYGATLDEKAREILESYYYYDMSLAEISENMNISRAGVRDYVVRYTDQLYALNNALKLQERLSYVNIAVNELISTETSTVKLEKLEKIKAALNL